MSCPACHHPDMKYVYRFTLRGRSWHYQCSKCGNVLTANSYEKRMFYEHHDLSVALMKSQSLTLFIWNVIKLVVPVMLAAVASAYIIVYLTDHLK